MLENSNKAIAMNSMILYIKMIVGIICGLFTTRFALEALGVVDYGLFSVLGGIISFITVINTIQVSTSNRFMAVSIGKGDLKEINSQFNVNFFVHLAIALITIIFAIPIGKWYINLYLNYEGNLSNAELVFVITIISSVITFIGVPYNGLLMAKERFIVFSVIDIISHVAKLIFTYFLITNWDKKLILYTIVISFLSVYPVFVYFLYCKKKWPDIVKLKFERDTSKYKEVFSFSGWVAYGAVACIAKSQGAAIVINLFFSTVMNTALGIANSINSYILQFAQNVTQPMAPQISKSYAAGNIKRTDELLVMSTKFSYMIMLLMSLPFFICPETILKLWLGTVPDYSVVFVQLLIVDALINSINSGISNVIFASGNIKMYQIVINTLRVLSVVFAYFLLKMGFEVYSLFYSYILFSAVIVIVSHVILNKNIHYDGKFLIKKSYFPSFVVTLSFIPILFLRNILPVISLLPLSMVYLVTTEWFFGLSKSEKFSIINKIKQIKS